MSENTFWIFVWTLVVIAALSLAGIIAYTSVLKTQAAKDPVSQCYVQANTTTESTQCIELARILRDQK